VPPGRRAIALEILGLASAPSRRLRFARPAHGAAGGLDGASVEARKGNGRWPSADRGDAVREHATLREHALADEMSMTLDGSRPASDQQQAEGKREARKQTEVMFLDELAGLLRVSRSTIEPYVAADQVA
jgi:hypothetical protein